MMHLNRPHSGPTFYEDNDYTSQIDYFVGSTL